MVPGNPRQAGRDSLDKVCLTTGSGAATNTVGRDEYGAEHRNIFDAAQISRADRDPHGLLSILMGPNEVAFIAMQERCHARCCECEDRDILVLCTM